MVASATATSSQREHSYRTIKAAVRVPIGVNSRCLHYLNFLLKFSALIFILGPHVNVHSFSFSASQQQNWYFGGTGTRTRTRTCTLRPSNTKASTPTRILMTAMRAPEEITGNDSISASTSTSMAATAMKKDDKKIETETNTSTYGNKSCLSTSASATAFESLQSYIKSIQPLTQTSTSTSTKPTSVKTTSINAGDSDGNSDTDTPPTFTCALIPKEDIAFLHESTAKQQNLIANVNVNANANATILQVNTLIFRPISTTILQGNEDESPSPNSSSHKNMNMYLYAVAIVPSTNKVDVRAFSEVIRRLHVRAQRAQNVKSKTGDGDSNNWEWELAPSHLVQDLCGFSPGCIPPLLVPRSAKQKYTSNNNPVDVDDDGGGGGGGGNDDMNNMNKRYNNNLPFPFATIIDSSLVPHNDDDNTNNDQCNDANANNDNDSLLLLGGGGDADHRCLINAKFMMERVFEISTRARSNSNSNSNNNNNYVAISSIVRFEGKIPKRKASVTNTNTHPGPERARARGCDSNSNKHWYHNASNKKPYFPIAPPVTSLDFVSPIQSDQQQQNQQQPHRPVPVTAIGRITSVRQIAKRLVFCDFAPPDYDYSFWLTNKSKKQDQNQGGTDTNMSVMGPPWRSGEDGKDMHVQIIVGRTFCERFEDGTEQLKNLKPGKLILVRGAANVDPMQKNGWRNSAGNWAQKRSLDVIVSSFEILDSDDNDNSLQLLVEEAQKERNNNGNWNSLLPWERKRDYERRAVAGMDAVNGDDALGSDKNNQSMPPASSNTNNADNTLTLDRFNSQFRDSPLEVIIVDGDDSIRAMAKILSELFSLIGKEEDQTGEFLDYVAGIDCEWRPTGAYAEALLDGPNDNPVALLQICIPAIGKVYLVDTYKILRANLADAEPMNTNEEIISEAIGSLFGSDRVIKVGYSVANDFRRLAGSFPHMSAFCNVRSVVELSTLAQRLHPTSERSLLGSLQRLTKLVLGGYNIAKEQQCSNWEARPLTPNQIEYAALDCALPPRLLDQMTEGSGTAKTKEIIREVTSSLRFQTLDSDRKDAIRLLQAKRVVGNTFVVSQSWLQDRGAPAAVSLPAEGGGAYTDKSGILRMPANLVSIANGNEDARWKRLSGKFVGKSKGKCIDLLLGDSLPEDASLEYNPRSGFIAFKDGLALFVNILSFSSRKMPYPNEWLEDGRMLTWFIRQKDWDDGRSMTAKLLLGLTKSPPPTVVLFARVGNGEFICCGNCKASLADKGDKNVGTSNKKLVKLNLQLQHWEHMKDLPSFSEMLKSAEKTQNNKNSQRRDAFAFDPVSFQLRLARMVVDGNMIGAFGMALDEANVSPAERSITNGVNCVKSNLSNSDDPLALNAMEIMERMTF